MRSVIPCKCDRKLFSFLKATLGLYLAFGYLSATVAQPEATKQENQTVFKPTRDVVSVKILNPNKHKLEIWFTGPSKHQSVLTSHSKTIPLKLEEGKYFVNDTETETSYPLPAIHFATGDETLLIEISEPNLLDEKSQMALIPSGPSLIGDEVGVGARDEHLSIENIEAFWIGQYEVTNEKYVAFLNAKMSCMPEWLDLQSRKCRIAKDDAGKFSTDAPRQPVVMVSHAGAMAYCQWLTEETGENYRLPTEFEWEKAARGPYSFVYSYGNRYGESRANQESGIVSNVGRFDKSPWGMYDMTGNVFEWMLNRYEPDEPDMVMNQALRGGSYVLDGMYLRNSFRMRQSPTVMTDDIGFRVVKEYIKPDPKRLP